MQHWKTFQLRSMGDFAPLMAELCTLLRGENPPESQHYGYEIGLVGPLGIGKTCLVSQLVKALGVHVPVSSPSYVLAHEYTRAAHGGEPALTIEHWDLYRIKELPDELYEPVPPQTIRLIEWANKMPGYQQNLDWLLEGEFLEEAAQASEASQPVASEAGLSEASLGAEFGIDPVPEGVLRQWRLFKAVREAA